MQFAPGEPGFYHFTSTIGESNGLEGCLEVCDGFSVSLSGDEFLRVTEEDVFNSTGYTPLDLINTPFTISAWIKLSQQIAFDGEKRYILVQGSSNADSDESRGVGLYVVHSLNNEVRAKPF